MTINAISMDNSRINHTDLDYGRLGFFILLSLVGHLIFFLLVLYLPRIAPARTFSPSMISVSLVSRPAASPPKGVPGKKPAPEIKKSPAVKKKPESVKPRPELETKQKTAKKSVKTSKRSYKSKTSMKKKTLKTEKVVDSAVSRVKAKVEKKAAASYADTLARLAQKVEEESKSRQQPEGVPWGSESGGGQQTSEQLAIYKTNIIYHIQENWAFPEQLAGGQTGLEALLGIKIMPDGEIREIWFDKRSGNRLLDESAEKALLKSSPLPPLPAGFKEPYLITGVRFTPSGVR